MATMLRMPDSATIMAARGRLDFYLWKGLPCCRSWPKYNYGRTRTAGEILSSNRFSVAVAASGRMGPQMQQYFKNTWGVGQGVTWVDAQRAMYLGRSWLHYG